MIEIELSSLDLRYEKYRMKHRTGEARLLASIIERGIDEPLEGVDVDGRHILLNGFKRCRCARKAGLNIIPYLALAEDEAAGILALLRMSNARTLSILEQAGFVVELRRQHEMTVAEIAEAVKRGKSWVSMRLNLMNEMHEAVREDLFSGAFPVYSYMYTLRPFMRMNSVDKEDIGQFVAAVGGRGLSTREIEYLAHGYFRGPDCFAEEVRQGKVAVALEQMKQIPPPADGCNEFERLLIRDLEQIQKYMRRIPGKSVDQRVSSSAFFAQAHLLSAGVLSRAPSFLESMRSFHDRCGQAQGSLRPASKRRR